MKNRMYGWLVAAAALAALAIVLPLMAAGGGSKEEKVQLQDCPEVVQKAIQKAADGAEIIEIEKETGKDGQVVYEAEVKKADGKKVDVKVSQDGKLIEEEDDEDDDGDEEDDEEDDEA